MPLAETLPFGLRDVKLFPISATGTVGAAVDLPVGRTFSFAEAEDFEELRGDDKVITRRGSGPSVEFSLEEGGISLDAYKVLAGGTLVDSGVTPNQKRVFSKKVTDSRPFFRVEGQAISDSGGDWHVNLPRCRVTGNLEGELSDQSFWLTSCDGTAFPTAADLVYEFVQNETPVAIA